MFRLAWFPTRLKRQRGVSEGFAKRGDRGDLRGSGGHDGASAEGDDRLALASVAEHRHRLALLHLRSDRAGAAVGAQRLHSAVRWRLEPRPALPRFAPTHYLLRLRRGLCVLLQGAGH